jgi:hypothetical protein
MKEETLPVLSEPASEMFHRAFSDSSSLAIDCEFCGRTFFKSGGDYDDGELEKLQANAKANPDKYVETDDYTSWYYLSGKQCVAECPCNAARHYENFIWRYRRQISTYLKLRAEGELRLAQHEANIVNQIPAKL